MVTSTDTVPSRSVIDEMQEAAIDASASAKRAAAVTRRALSLGIYKTAYVSTYGVVFASVFLIELLPKGHPRSVAAGEIRLLENKKKGAGLKLSGDNSPGSENTDARIRIPIQTPESVRRRAAAFDSMS